MSSHPDADAFVRAILDNPAELTIRLAFADWLEETGTPSNVAWARFIRLMAEAEKHPPGNSGWKAVVQQAEVFASRVEAKLAVGATHLARNIERLRYFLPAPNLTLQLVGYDIPQPAIELMPESVARENVIIPVQLSRKLLTIAAADPTNADTLLKIAFILNKEVFAVRAATEEIVAAVNKHYGQHSYESIDCVSYEAPRIGLQDDPISEGIYMIFYTAFSRNCSGFEMKWGRPECVLRYAARSEPVPEERHSPEVFARLLGHFLSLPADAKYRQDAIRCRDFDIPLLSGRRFPVTLDRRRGLLGTSWFRVRFRWEDRE